MGFSNDDNMSELNILSYNDYREFLKKLYEQRKEENKKYSYRKLAEDLGFNASNYIHLVIQRKRNLSEDAIGKIKKAIAWTAKEKNFFENLVLFNQATQKEDKIKYKGELDKIITSQRQMLNPDHEAYFSNWYIPVLREIVSLKNFVSNLNWISKKLKPIVSEDKVREAFTILERLKMIHKDSKNIWVQSVEHLTTPSEITSHMVYNFQKEMLNLSIQALEIPAQQRDITSMTIGLSQEQYNRIKEKLATFRDEIQQELQETDSDETMVAQLNLQLFPVTEE
jgi:uncharacterized protein (TIGR02147 family)